MKHLTLLLVASLLLISGCGEGNSDKSKKEGGEKTSAKGDGTFTILATYIDNFDEEKKSANPELALAKYKDIDCMIGLFEYNPPKIFAALKDAKKLGKVKVVGFDENPETLQQIREGNCQGTVAQNPFMYGYKSVEILSKMIAGDTSDINEDKYFDVPAQKVEIGNVDVFEKTLKDNLAAADTIRQVPNGKAKIAYVTNGVAEFWNIAKAGAMKAGKEFDCTVQVVMPNAEGGRAANQKAELEKLIANKFQGIAVSPVNPDNQTDILNQVGDAAEYITHDSDAPKSNRKLYIGMSNYDAGFMVADLVKKALPDGGNVVLFIGSVDQLNGQLRRQGVIDGLLGREKDETRRDPIDGAISE